MIKKVSKGDSEYPPLGFAMDWRTLYDKRNDTVFFLKFSETMNVDAFVDLLDAGDIVFSRSNTFFGSLIQYSGHCMWNHVAMCVLDPDTREKYWWESTNSNDDTDEACKGIPKDCAGNYPTGARIWPLRKRLEWMLRNKNDDRFPCFRMGVSKLFGMTGEEKKKFERKLYDVVLSESGKRYENSYWPLILSWYDGWRSLRNIFTCFYDVRGTEVYDYGEAPSTFNVSDVSMYFCSELVMETLKMCGLTKNVPGSSLSESSGEWTVADMANTNNLNAHANDGISFSPLRYVSLVGR